MEEPEPLIKRLSMSEIGALMKAHAEEMASKPIDYTTWWEMQPQYIELVKPTYIESWPDALCRLSVAQTRIKLTMQDAEDIGASNGEWAECFPLPHYRDLSLLEKKLDDAISKFPNGAYVRLGSRSPKDCWLGWKEGFKATTGKRALELLCGSSERVFEDLKLATINNYEPSIWVRQWLDIKPWQEWRCFHKEGKFVGASQYNYHDYCEEIEGHVDMILWGIKQFHSEFFVPAIHLPSSIFDVIAIIKQRTAPSGMKQSEIQIKLLEINPFFGMTDPCLFNWAKEDEWQGQARYLDKDKKTIELR